MMMRQIEILHKQIKQITLLLVQLFRSFLEHVPTKDGQNAKTNKHVNFLHQILLIANWVNNFDAMSVNDCFDNHQNVVPPKLLTFARQIEQDMKSIDSMKLSPSRPFLNEKIKG